MMEQKRRTGDNLKNSIRSIPLACLHQYLPETSGHPLDSMPPHPSNNVKLRPRVPVHYIHRTQDAWYTTVHLIAPSFSGVLNDGLVAQAEAQEVEGEHAVACLDQCRYVVSPVVHASPEPVDQDQRRLAKRIRGAQ